MAREYAHLHPYYLPQHEPGPPHDPHHSYHHYNHQSSSASAEAGAFEVTSGGGADAHAPHHHDAHKHAAAYGSEGYEAPAPLQPAPATTTRKRKASSYSGTSSAYDEEVGGDESSRSSHNTSDKKQNHSEIEKRRRDKMNTYISELSSMIPMCGAMARKLDKLTVLRMAVAHLRSVRGALSACPLAAPPPPAVLPARDVNALVLHAARDAFLLVVGCDRGRLLYVSASVKHMLHYDQSELVGQSLFDILHPKDVAKVKEQLSSPDLSPRERLIDAKTMLPVAPDVVSASCLCLGARRSFFCRIKCKAPPDDVKQEGEPAALRKSSSDKKYCVVQCTGYLKSWAGAEVGGGGAAGGGGGGEEAEAGSVSCLVAVGRRMPGAAPPASPASPAAAPHAPPAPARRTHYVSRHAPDGKFLFVDQRVTLALGFLPQELLGSSLYEYVPPAELAAVARAHKAALVRREPLHTPPYCFRKKDGSYARITTHFKPFRNPWTKEVECLVADNAVEPPCAFPPLYKPGEVCPEEEGVWAAAEGAAAGAGAGAGAAAGGGGEDVRRLIAAQVESHKIGATIEQEALRGAASEPDLPTDLLLDPAFPHQISLMDGMAEACYGAQVRNNVALSAGAASSPPPPASPPLPPLDGNGEAAMAVIMSLLEADAGLGGPINFSGLPWPLP